MTNLNLANPFANTEGLVSVIPGIPAKLTGIPSIQTNFMPTTPNAGVIVDYQPLQQYSDAQAYQTVMQLIESGAIQVFNNSQIQAIANSNSYCWQIPFENTQTSFNQLETQDIAIAYDAILSLQSTGLLMTPGDLANNLVNINILEGYGPNGAQTIICNDDHFICELPNSGLWLASNVANALSWNPLSAGSMESFNDQPIALAQYQGFVVVFGQQSLEFWEDQGLIPFPYVRMPGCSQNYGLGAVSSIAQFQGTVVFLGGNRTGQLHVMALNGTSVPSVISTPDLDEIINNQLSYPGQAQAYSYDNNGYSFYRITFPEQGPAGATPRTFDYCGSNPNLGNPPGWNEIQSGTADSNRHLASFGTTFSGSTIVSDYTSGNVYILDPNNLTDNGYPIKRMFASKHVKNEFQEISIDELYIDIQVGASQQAGAVAPFTAEAHIQLEVSYDGGYTWSQPMIESLGTVGNYTTKVVWRALGSSRDFVFRFTSTDPVSWIITAGYAIVSPTDGY